MLWIFSIASRNDKSLTILAKAVTFWQTFLHNIDKWEFKLRFLSIMTPSNCSLSLSHINSISYFSPKMLFCPVFANFLQTQNFQKGDQKETHFTQKGDQRRPNSEEKGDLY